MLEKRKSAVFQICPEITFMRPDEHFLSGNVFWTIKKVSIFQTMSETFYDNKKTPSDRSVKTAFHAHKTIRNFAKLFSERYMKMHLYLKIRQQFFGCLNGCPKISFLKKPMDFFQLKYSNKHLGKNHFSDFERKHFCLVFPNCLQGVERSIFKKWTIGIYVVLVFSGTERKILELSAPNFGHRDGRCTWQVQRDIFSWKELLQLHYCFWSFRKKTFRVCAKTAPQDDQNLILRIWRYFEGLILKIVFVNA